MWDLMKKDEGETGVSRKFIKTSNFRKQLIAASPEMWSKWNASH